VRHARRHILNLALPVASFWLSDMIGPSACFARVASNSNHTKKKSAMAAGCVYWLAGHNLNEISKTLEVFRDHDGWRGEIVNFSSILQSFRSSACFD